jgi:hypothetical protein
MKFPKDIFWVSTPTAEAVLEKQRLEKRLQFMQLQLYATREMIKHLKKELKKY